MKAEQELFHTYQEWLRLAWAEHRAILTHNWSLLADCDLAIGDFQTHITDLVQKVRADWQQGGCDLAEKERQLQSCIAEVAAVTHQNHTLLQSTLEAAREHLDQLGETGRNLKRLRRSYGLMPHPAYAP